MRIKTESRRYHGGCRDGGRRTCRYGSCVRILCRHNVVTGGWFRWRCRCGWSRISGKFYRKGMQYRDPAPVKKNRRRKRNRKWR